MNWSSSNMFTSPLIDGAETAHGMWVRQLTLLNPVGGRENRVDVTDVGQVKGLAQYMELVKQA